MGGLYEGIRGVRFAAGDEAGIAAMPARRLTVTTLTLLCALVVGMLVSAPVSALPPERHYEMVSPPYKGGYGVLKFEAAAMQGAREGERAVFTSLGTFAGAPQNGAVNTAYVASRGASGWSTSPLLVPATLAPEGGGVQGIPPALGSVLFENSKFGANIGASEFLGTEAAFFTHSVDAPDVAPNASEPDPSFAGIPNPAPYFELMGEPLKRIDGKPPLHVGSEGISANLCNAIVRSGAGSAEGEPLLHDAIAKGGLDKENDLYEVGGGAQGCGEHRFVRLLGVSNAVNGSGEPVSISAHCHTLLGGQYTLLGGHFPWKFNAISADGSTVFFTVGVGNLGEVAECNDAAHPNELFVRLNGERTLQVSKADGASCEVGEPCPGQQEAQFMGADEAGSRVFFATTQPLLPGVTDTSRNLYLANIGCPEVDPGCAPGEREVTSRVLVSKTSGAGEAAEVQGLVLAVSPDGTRAYFVAHGVLSMQGPVSDGVQQEPVRGADNLYVYDAREGGGAVHFIADLCSGPEQSGEAPDARCPTSVTSGITGAAGNDTGLWGESQQDQTAGADGRYLLFATFAQLLPGDGDNGSDIYRYDAQSGALERISIGEGGESANGNANGYDAQIPISGPEALPQVQYAMAERAISEDGSRIVFETAEPLSPAAGNHRVNAYEWHDGRVSLVSDGSYSEPVDVGLSGLPEEIAITPSGRDIFFKTSEKLVAQDTDNAVDVYDARLGAGFPEAPAEISRCKGDACQGPLTNPAPLLVPGSVVQQAGENLTRPPSSPAPKALVKAKKKRKVKRRIRHRAKHAPRRGRNARRGRKA